MRSGRRGLPEGGMGLLKLSPTSRIRLNKICAFRRDDNCIETFGANLKPGANRLTNSFGAVQLKTREHCTRIRACNWRLEHTKSYDAPVIAWFQPSDWFQRRERQRYQYW